MNRRIVIILQALILLAVGAVMVTFYAQGRMDRYLTGAGTFQIQALLAGIALGIIALFLILTSGKEDGCDHEHHDHGDDESGGHHHHHEETSGGLAVTGLIILVPLITAAILTPDEYSDRWVKKHVRLEQGVVGPAPAAFDLRKPANPSPANQVASDDSGVPGQGNGKQDAAAAAGWGPYTLDDFKAQVDQNPDGDYQLDVISIFYTGGDEEVRNVVDGLPIETMGQIMPETVRNPDGTRVRVFRLMMNCCIADARPVSIPVEFAGEVPNYKEMGWYKFYGTMSYEQWDEFTIPVLRADRMEPTQAPEQATFGR